MFTQALYEAIKRFQSHFSREVVYVKKDVNVDFWFFGSIKYFGTNLKKISTSILLL